MSSADEVEAIFSASRFALTRFANNKIHQNVEEENASWFRSGTNFGGRTARATANQFDDESLRRAVVASENLALVQVPDPDLLPMPTSDEANFGDEFADKSVRGARWFDRTAVITPAERASVVQGIVSVANRHSLTTAGFTHRRIPAREFSIRGDWGTGIGRLLAEVSITMLGEDSSGWQKANSPDVSQSRIRRGWQRRLRKRRLRRRIRGRLRRGSTR